MTTSEHIQQVYDLLCEWMEPKHAKIVTAQAVVETGWFTSDAFHLKNNPFGLSWKGEVQTFDDIAHACREYHDQIYIKYEQETDYYQFLEKLPYAEDSLYIWKVKHVNLKLKKNEQRTGSK